jgi:hypothetical protein
MILAYGLEVAGYYSTVSRFCPFNIADKIVCEFVVDRLNCCQEHFNNAPFWSTTKGTYGSPDDTKDLLTLLIIYLRQVSSPENQMF